jgi:hypothetical protein
MSTLHLASNFHTFLKLTLYLILSALHSGLRLPGNSSKATFLAKNVPAFCEVWFVSKGRHVWTREIINTSPEIYNADDSFLTKRIRFSVSSTSTEESENNSETDLEPVDLYQTEHTIFEASGVTSHNRGAAYVAKISYLNDLSSLGSSPPFWPDSTADVRFQSKLKPQVL